MPTINQATCGDGFTDATTIANVWNPGGGWFSITTHGAFISLQYPIQKGSGFGQAEWTDEQQLAAGAFGFIPSGATGIKFRNAVAGSNAVVTATIAQGNEPALAISSLGNVTVSGTAPTRTVITTPGASTYNTPAACIAILVECIGGGGAGGGSAATAAGQVSTGGGGGGGGYAAAFIASPVASYPVVVGSGGVGVAGAAGGPGGASTFNATISGGGGGGGGAGGAGAPPIAGNTGGGGGNGTGGSLNLVGQPGFVGQANNTLNIVTGGGGAAARGGGGAGSAFVAGGGAAGNGNLYGGGGASPAGGSGNAARPGGSGAQGVVIVTEFY